MRGKQLFIAKNLTKLRQNRKRTTKFGLRQIVPRTPLVKRQLMMNAHFHALKSVIATSQW